MSIALVTVFGSVWLAHMVSTRHQRKANKLLTLWKENNHLSRVWRTDVRQETQRRAA